MNNKMVKFPKHVVCAVVMLFCTGLVTVSAQQKMSFAVRQLCAEHQQGLRRAGSDAKVPVFLKFKGESGEQLLGKYGCDVVTRIGAVHIANVPVDQLAAMAAEDDVVRIETHLGGRPLMDVTPKWIKSDPVYQGQQLPQAYTGRGVLLGIVDTGFDLTHPTFYNADGTKYRVRSFVDDYHSADETIGTLTPIGREYTTERDILAKAHSGDIEGYHGTHCLSIAAGSGYDTKYRGVAYEADLFAISTRDGAKSTASPTEVARMKRIFDYAEANHQPCVITYSVGFDYIPGDNELFHEALEGVQGPGRVLVVAAGNSNRYPTYIEKPIGVETAGAAIVGMEAKSMAYMLSEQPFRLKMITLKSYAGGSSFEKSDSTVFDSAQLSADTTVLNGQHAIVTRKGNFYAFSSRRATEELNGHEEQVLLCIEGSDAAVRMYVSANSFFVNIPAKALGDGRFSAAERSHNVALPANFENVLTVGALVGRTSIINIRGNEVSREEESKEGVVTTFSSVGPTLDGRNKPDVVAPGLFIIAAGNSYNKNQGSGHVSNSTFKGRDYPWVARSGTSMATPCTAGIVALWLQADPTLTPEKVKDIIKATSHQVVADLPSPNNTYGYGLIDAYAGICMVLGVKTTIPGVSTHQPSALDIRPFGDSQVALRFTSAPKQPFTVRIFALNGQLMGEQTLQPSDATSYSVALPSASRGVVLVQVNSPERGVTGSNIIRF